jgi:menaquinone-dependent protoporphyrinogen oxidase
MKVLVVYGSKRGGTAGLAGMIGGAFQRAGWTAEVRNAEASDPISDADIVVIGGALYMNRWHRAARGFARRHRGGLRSVPVWLFSSGPLDDTARQGSLAAVPQVQSIAADLDARGHMTFGGRLEADARGLLARSMAKQRSGDWRDATHVAEWVHQILHDFIPVEIVLPAARTAPAAAEVAAEVPIPPQRGRSRTVAEA